MSVSQLPVKNKSEVGKLLTVSAFRQEVRKTHPHKHSNYLEVIFFSAGSGYHTIDENRYPVEPPTVFFIKQEQVHFLELDEYEIPQGYVLILKPEFLTECMDWELRKIIAEVTATPSIKLQADASFEVLFQLIEAENKHILTIAVLEGLLKALFAKIRILAPNIPTGAQGNLYQAFQGLLEKQVNSKNEVAYYAGLLHTTPQNLNAACRRYVGMAASEVIAQSVNNEARRLLTYTRQTVAEIAFQLDFSDPSHFTRYFKRHTGVTPLQYRMQLS